MLHSVFICFYFQHSLYLLLQLLICSEVLITFFFSDFFGKVFSSSSAIKKSPACSKFGLLTLLKGNRVYKEEFCILGEIIVFSGTFKEKVCAFDISEGESLVR